MARPPLPRWRGVVTVVVEYSAADQAQADERLGELTRRSSTVLTRAVRAARNGASRVVDVDRSPPVLYRKGGR